MTLPRATGAGAGVLEVKAEGRVNAGAETLQHWEALYMLHTVAHARKPGTRGLLGPATVAPELPDLSADETLFLDLQTKGLTETGRHPLDAHRVRLRDVQGMPLAGVRHGNRCGQRG